MKYSIILLSLFLMGAFAFAIIDPSSAYCVKMGYKYKTTKTSNGETGVCIVNGTSYDSWSFFTGKVGQQYSYCAKMGYDTATSTQTDGLLTIEYAVCTPKKPSKLQVIRTYSINGNTNVSMLDLMQRNGMNLVNNSDMLQPATAPSGTVTSSSVDTQSTQPLPSSFDWRNVKSRNWMTPIKDQQSCGSCWAFGVLGAVEAKFKIESNNANSNYDLSEQQLVSCSTAGTCRGGWPETALNYVKNTGIASESCFPYVARDVPCNLCSGWANKITKITSFISVTPSTTEAYKRALMTYGPLTVGLDAWRLYAPGSSDLSGLNHAVVLVGWNDAGGYWIIKNSWGTGWGDNGYGKIRYGEIEQYRLAYAIGKPIPPPYDVPEFDTVGVILLAGFGLLFVVWRSTRA